MLRKKIKNILLLLIIILGFALAIIDVSEDIIRKANEKEQIKSYINNENYVVNENTNNKINDSNKYMGVLEIPEIKLLRGFYSLDSKYNDVSSNVEILNPYVALDKKDSIVIFAAHSGNSKVSYFKNLDKLKENDIVKIYYKKKLYIYKIIRCIESNKNGTINLNNISLANKVVLTTCKNGKVSKQFTCISDFVLRKDY